MQASELSVLVIDDKTYNRVIIKGLLKKLGIQSCDEAGNEQEATHCLANKCYHLVLSDTMDEENRPIGPNAIRKANLHGQISVVVGLSDGRVEHLWTGLADYFFYKDYFTNYDAPLKKVLREKFGIQ